MSEKITFRETEIDKPSIEQVAWVLKNVHDHMIEGGSFRYFIYNRMGFGPEAYIPLYENGGMSLSNAFHELRELETKQETTYEDF